MASSRLATFTVNGAQKYGAVTDAGIVDLIDLIDVIDGRREIADAAAEIQPFDIRSGALVVPGLLGQGGPGHQPQ